MTGSPRRKKWVTRRKAKYVARSRRASERPSYETAATAVARLDAQFGGEDLDQPQRLAELRLFATAEPGAVEAATLRACKRFTRRPTPDELGQLLRDELHGHRAEAS